MNKTIHFILVSFLLTFAVSSIYADSGEFTSYQILKGIDLPDYDEWRLTFDVETTTWENFDYNEGLTTPVQNGWHETLMSAKLEWGFWTFSRGDLNLGIELPYLFWYAKEDLKALNNASPDGLVRDGGIMDLKAFADFKFKLTDNIYLLAHGGVTIPGVSTTIYSLLSGIDADEINTDLGVVRATVMGGVLLKYNRFAVRALFGAEVGGSPDYNPDLNVASEYAPQMAEWTNTTLPILNISSIFVATANMGAGADLTYKGKIFEDGAWDTNNLNQDALPDGVPESVLLLTLKLYFSTSTGGFYSADSGSIFSFGLGSRLSDSDLQPSVRYTLTYSQYF